MSALMLGVDEDEPILIGSKIVIKASKFRSGFRLRLEAPSYIPVLRSSLLDRIRRDDPAGRVAGLVDEFDHLIMRFQQKHIERNLQQ